METCNNGHEKCPENTVQYPSMKCAQCKLCRKEDLSKARLRMKTEHPERWKEYLRGRNLRKRFRLSVEAYERLLKDQKYRCLGCDRHRDETGTLRVDHDHSCCPDRNKTCGKCIRGLLCQQCNHALGLVRDNPSVLRKLAIYLEEYHGSGKS